MQFRYFDPEGREMTFEQLRMLRVSTPAMEHMIAAVAERLGKTGKQTEEIEKRVSEC